MNAGGPQFDLDLDTETHKAEPYHVAELCCDWSGGPIVERPASTSASGPGDSVRVLDPQFLRGNLR